MATTQEKVVVLGIDESEHSERAFNWYVSTAHREGYKLYLVHCIEAITAIAEVPSPDLYERMLDGSRQKTKQLEEKYKQLLKQTGVNGEILTLFGGKPGEVICETAKKQHALMIVMGTRGLGMLRRTIMGSVSDYVVHHAHCPVAICRK